LAKIADLVIQLTVETAELRRDLDLAQKKVADFARNTRTSSRSIDFGEAKGSLALLGEEIGVTIPRHLRSFIVAMPGVGKALSAAFSSVAVIALGGLIVETGRKIAEFAQKTKEAPEELHKAFEVLNSDSRKTNDELAVTNDKLQLEIDKLQNKPVNNLKLALDESRLAADNLANSIATVNDKIAKILKEKSFSTIQEIFNAGGIAKTSDVAEKIQKYQEETAKIARDYNIQLHETNNSVDAIALTKKRDLDLEDQRLKILKFINDELDKSQKRINTPAGAGSVISNNTAANRAAAEAARQELLRGLKEQVLLQGEFNQLSSDNTSLNNNKRIAQTLHDQSEEAKKYAEQLANADNKVNDIVDRFTGATLDPFQKIDRDYANAISDLTDIWNQYPEERAKIEDRIVVLVKARLQRVLEEEQKALDETNKLIAKALQEKGPDIKSVPIITPTVKPKLDTSELPSFYAQAVQQLAKFGTDAEKELAKITAVDRIKQSVDELILRTGTAAGGARVFFRQYAQYATDTAQVVHDAFAKIFGALEDQLTNLLAHFKFDFKSLLDTIKESIARAVVQKFILGPIAKALGLAKADGSKDNPYHVIVDNGGGGIGSGIPGLPGASGGDGGGTSEDPTGGILGKLQDTFGKVFSSIGSFFAKIGSAIGSIFKSIVGAIGGLFGGGFADGGDIMPGKFYLVGERGPELIAPRSSGTVIPNHALGGSHTANNIVNNFYLSPVRSDPFGYSQSQLANAVFTGNMRAMSRA
jgi:hypothetical protein